MATPAQDLLDVLVKTQEGTRKEGFTLGGVTYQLNSANDTLTGTFTIPVSIQTDPTTKNMVIIAQDFIEFPEWAESEAP